MEPERWLPVVGYEGIYEVSSIGRVRSLPRAHVTPSGGRWVRKGGMLKANKSTHKPARLTVELFYNGVGAIKQIHRLVAMAHISPPPDGSVCCHNDGDPSNNVVENLRWATQKENQADRVKHGTKVEGEMHWQAKANPAIVERMFDLRKAGCTITSIGAWLGMSRAQTSQILQKKHWKHLHV